MTWIPEPQPKSNTVLSWLALGLAVLAIVFAFLIPFAQNLSSTPTPPSEADMMASQEAVVNAIVTQIQPTLIAQVIQQITASAPPTTVSPVIEQVATTLTPSPTPTLTPTTIPTNTPQPTTPPPPSTAQVELMAGGGGASFTVSLKPASVLNQSNDTPVSPREGSQAVYSRCYPSEFSQTPPVDEAKAIPFELVFSGQGLTSEQTVTITLTTQGNFVAVKRGIDGSCVDATQHTNSGSIALGVSAGVTSQQATVYYLVPDDTTTITTPPIFTVTATLAGGTVLAPVVGTSDQLRVLPLMRFTGNANIRHEKSLENNTTIIRQVEPNERVRVVAIEGEGIDQWAQVEFDAQNGIVERIGYINIGHDQVQETFIGRAEWVQ